MNIKEYDKQGKLIDATSKTLKKKGIYKLFVNENKFNEIISILKLENKIDISKIEIDFETGYLCVYVGQTRCGGGFYQRIIENHLSNSYKISTLRRTLKAIFDKNDTVNEILNKNSFFVIIPVDKNINNFKKVINDKEKEEINKFQRILNIKENEFYKNNKSHYVDVRAKIKKLRGK